jgi:hypothetical protein
VNIQHLDFYIQLIITDFNSIESINWSLHFADKIMIHFKHEMDIIKIIETFQKNPLLKTINGHPIHLETVSLTKQIAVLIKEEEGAVYNSQKYEPKSIPATRDLLELYFSNKRRSNGGHVESVNRINSKYWLISMREHQTAKNIAESMHIIDEKPTKV